MPKQRRQRVRARREDLVLDVGSGGHPHPRADILVEYFINDNRHRNDRGLVKDRPLVCADICALPFADKAFGYVVCNQVVEHIPDAPAALQELARVGSRGFVATPTEFLEYISPHNEHLWVFARKGEVVLLKRKTQNHNLPTELGFGSVFWSLHAIPLFKRLMRRYENLFMVRLEWKDHIEFHVMDDNAPFFNYTDPDDFGELLVYTPPSSPGEWLREVVEVSLPLETVRKIGGASSSLRRFIRQVTSQFRTADS